MNTRDLLSLSPVMPVLVIEDLAKAVPLARALVAGGIRVLEVTLRTPAALEAIHRISLEVPEAVIGAGTLLTPEDVLASRGAGARFGVSPGATPALLQAARLDGWKFIPGVMTPSEILAALEAGYDTLKFFPTGPAGGTQMLKAFEGPFPQVRFCPTGGIDERKAAEYLALPNVPCVGGSWLAPRDMVANSDWAGITRLAAAAAALKPK